MMFTMLKSMAVVIRLPPAAPLTIYGWPSFSMQTGAADDMNGRL
jgi:hypothetical protein